jgi:anaerobic ribonucleoside-triphosphate reductase
MPPLIVWPKEKTKVLTTNSNVTQHLRRPKLTVLNLVDHPLKTKTIFIDKGHDNHITHDLHYHDLTFYRLCKTHVSHDN